VPAKLWLPKPENHYTPSIQLITGRTGAG